MVLRPVKQTLCLVLCALISACAGLYQTQSDNRFPDRKVVPVEAEKTESKQKSVPGTRQEQPVTDTPAIAPETVFQQPQLAPQAPTPEPAATPKKNQVLDTLLLQASKAIDNQQWLRAQNHLEHALRIAPKHAQTFYLYAHVYHGLGVQDQARQMLKRALFLSKPGSDLHRSVKEKLAALPE